MNFKSVVCLTAGFLTLTAGVSFAQDNLVKSLKKNKSEKSIKLFKFKDIINLENTSIKNQGHSGTCWSYSTNSFLESEMASAGKQPVDLAEMFTVRNAYIEKGKQYVRMHGAVTLGDGGECHDVINMYREYGAVPQSVYNGMEYDSKLNDFSEMSSIMSAVLKAVVHTPGNKKLYHNWLKAYTGVIDAYLGTPPDTFTYKGKTYTPKTFAKEIVGLDPDNYVELSSLTEYPVYKPFVLPVPDNWAMASVYNVAFNDITTIIDSALYKGYTVAWATDVSEKSFSWKNGVAYVPEKDYADMTDEEKEDRFMGPKPEKTVTAEMREQAFNNYETTDDHGMQIVGLAKDKDGKEYYIVKNSWGVKNDYKGYLYVTKNYVRYKTTAFLLNKKALPAAIRGKLDI
jgi:bleomycin hydrolase